MPGAHARRIIPTPFSLEADLCPRETGLEQTPRTLLKGEQETTRGDASQSSSPRQRLLAMCISLQRLLLAYSFLGGGGLMPCREHSVELALMPA